MAPRRHGLVAVLLATALLSGCFRLGREPYQPRPTTDADGDRDVDVDVESPELDADSGDADVGLDGDSPEPDGDRPDGDADGDLPAPVGLTLDPDFGAGGAICFRGTAAGDDYISSVAIDSMHRIVAVGMTVNASTVLDLSIWRLLENGTLDLTFASLGGITYHASPYDWGSQVSIASGDRIVVGGNIDYGSDDPTIWRFTADGMADGTFGVGGRNHVTFAGQEVQGRGLAADPSRARYYLLGAQYENWLTVVAFGTEGVVDSAFGGAGHVEFSAPGPSFGRRMAVDSEGRIVVVGTSTVAGGRDALVVRFTPSGALDTTLCGVGYCLLDGASRADDNAAGLAIDPSDDLYVVGSWDSGLGSDLALWKLRGEDGSLEPSFGEGGMVIHDDAAGGSGADSGNGVVLDGGRLLVVGASEGPPPQGANVALWRFSTSGELDLSFGDGGSFAFDGGYGTDAGASVVVDRAGGFVIGGSSLQGDSLDACLWRVAPEEP